VASFSTIPTPLKENSGKVESKGSSLLQLSIIYLSQSTSLKKFNDTHKAAFEKGRK
jgi:hypothetical protein